MRRLRPSPPQARFPAVLALVFAFGAAAAAGQETAAAAAQDANPCLECHDDVVVVTAEPHGDLTCDECHSDIAEGHEKEKPRKVDDVEVCSGCHDGPAGGVEKGVHAGKATCTECHGSGHAITLTKEGASPMSARKQLATCGGCHDKAPGIVDSYTKSVHGRGLMVSGLADAPSCSDCHGTHAIHPSEDERSKLSRTKAPQTCGRCHQYLLDDWLHQSAHGAAYQDGHMKAPVCTTCHASHGVEEPRGELARHKFPQTCGDCHGAAFSSYRDSFHGKASDLGFVTTAICSDCHTPHANLSKDDPRASIHPDNLRTTCGACHGDVSASFVSFDPHSDPTDRERDPKVYWVWLAMTTLLLGVFAFFTVHAGLWLQRTVVAFTRGELKEARATEGPYIRRFSEMQIKTHVTVVITFLLLAATGLPLKFHYTQWARWMTEHLGGVGWANTIHRIAAIATFGYFAVHVGHVLHRALVKKEPGMFWGWKSLVPSFQDLRQMYENFRYFVYLGPRPAFDRWTYWEKFDYFAVFWGVAIIGASGLMLWFPDFVTGFLPGWTLNAAIVIHSDEALLATCFIFTFHFFNTHLRPESFPLDPVVFTGVMPLARFREERPAEYARLVERGELEAALVPPPGRVRLRNARIFGFAALFVGIALALGILWGFLIHA